ncbi:MAG TPA: SurA N-terminal domain-containing protein [Isosphaeraceae bacterium]|jgi:foldase protein PrsA
MIATERARRLGRILLITAAVGALGVGAVWAQQATRAGAGRSATTPRTQGAAPAAPQPAPTLTPVAIPVNPTDAIATVNGQSISRQQLADECVARSGKQVLETLIARMLIDQAIVAQRLEVSPQEIDEEIERVAGGIGREAWLRALDKERGISPAQYAREIIYPTVALRKLATPRTQVTPKDIQDGLEANFGEKLHCRVIMLSSLRAAQEVWNELKKNPGGFERIAKDRSIDDSTKAMGGLLPQAIARHAYPLNVSDAAFKQLVDGDPDDKDPAHQPKDGDFTGPIEVAGTTAWVILRRESVDPAQPYDRNDPKLMAQMKQMIFDAKLKEKYEEVFTELMKAAAINNKLTGHIKMANEETHPDFRVDGDVQRMSKPDQELPPSPHLPAAATAAKAQAATRK